MTYKTLDLNEEDFDFLTRQNTDSNSTLITDDELPDFLKFDIYGFLTYNCVEYAQNVEIDNLKGANENILNLYNFFNSNKEKFRSFKIDYSKIIKIYGETGFFYSLFYAVNDKGEEYVPNCSAFICIMTYLSNEFAEILSEKDFIYPLTNYYMEYYEENIYLTFDQKLNIVNSINNLIQYYRDKSFSVFFENSRSNFFDIFNAFERVMGNHKLLKFLYWLLTNASNELISIYPLIFKYYSSKIAHLFDEKVIEEEEEEPEEEEEGVGENILLFNLTLLLLYRLLKRNPQIINIIFKTGILSEISRIYIKNHEKLSIIKGVIINYYSMTFLVIQYYTIDTKDEADLKTKIITIFELIDLEDIIPMLSCEEDYAINNCALDLINALVKHKLFEYLFEKKTITITEYILNLLTDTPTNTKKKAFDCLYHIIKINYILYGETILKKIDSSILCDLIESDEYDLQKKTFKFINFALRQADILNTPLDQDSLKKSFAFNIFEDEELYNSIQSFRCPTNKDLEHQASLAYHKICFWVEA